MDVLLLLPRMTPTQVAEVVVVVGHRAKNKYLFAGSNCTADYKCLQLLYTTYYSQRRLASKSV